MQPTVGVPESRAAEAAPVASYSPLWPAPSQDLACSQLCCCMLNRSVESSSLQPRGLYPTRLLCPWDFLGKNTGVGCHFLLQGIFPTQGSDLCLLLGRRVLYHCATWETNLSASALPWSFFQRTIITRILPLTTGCSRGFS